MTAGGTPDIEGLERRAATLKAEADALTRRYRRTTWWRFVLVFFPVPFVVVLMRFELEAWHYVLAGAAYLGFSALLYVIDSAASARCDAATAAAERAQATLVQALSERTRPAHSNS